ncbi:HD domain-containing protein [uncultured Porphyromonas sp.]|uniref:HD domain-containing protein n=1 Tax=uncultured Porphyromonas sp. TaxID=159274 RepID=UPI00261E7B19|nr:HD domain-containing protein [uncultured Porphyromonas sp.]
MATKGKDFKGNKEGLDVYAIIEKYYQKGSQAYEILTIHSECVAKKALEIAKRRKAWKLDKALIYEGAMLHDIGIFKCNAPSIGCMGDEPYIKHGVIGSNLLASEGLPKHAMICERHTGVGITLEMIIERELPLPHREMVPISLEEQIICFADCFFSKSGDPTREKSVEQVAKSMSKHGADQVVKFETWCKMFLD